MTTKRTAKAHAGFGSREAYNKYMREYQKKQYWRLKDLIWSLIGEACRNCGLADKRVLDIDHIKGGGSKHRNSKSSWGVLQDVVRNPQDYRPLCKNCNWLAYLETL
jgi:hypothetical protein